MTLGRVSAYVLAALVLGGCGRADDRRAVAEVTARFLRAVDQRDGARACEQLSDGARDALEQDEGVPCAAAVDELEEMEPSRVTRAQVFVTAAQVDLADGHSAFLELTRNGWRVAAAGCRSDGGDAPYRCEVEA